MLRNKWKEETLLSVRYKWCSAAEFTFLLLVVAVFCKMAKENKKHYRNLTLYKRM